MATTLNITLRSVLRSTTASQDFTHTLTTANISSAATPIAQDLLAWTVGKTVQGNHVLAVFGGVGTLGGSATYHTLPPNAVVDYGVAATPGYTSAANAVDPEHRVSLNFSNTDLTNYFTLALAIKRELDAAYVRTGLNV